jgi:two-component system response regulator (stage 0 sporulation protein F)
MRDDQRMRLLYVDDEELNLMIFKTLLKDDFDIETEVLPRRAYDRIISERFDVVISDMKMPGMNGVELITKAGKVNDDPAYFILTGYVGNEEVQQALTDQIIDGWFEKPLDLQLLKKELNRNRD